MTQEHRNKSGFETRAIHAGYEPDAITGSVIPPIYATSTYKQDGVGGLRGGYEYSRSANPTRTALEGNLAALEEGERGFAFASGLAAEDTLLHAVCVPGDHVVIPDDAYGGTHRLFDKVAAAVGAGAHAPRRSTTPTRSRPRSAGRRKIVWIETPTNPLLNIGDIEALAAVAHDAGALLVVDNTFASPYLQQPLALGADVVVHSTTKYCGGHSDVIGGALVVTDLELAERIAFHQNAIGAVAGPFDAWLVLRGLKTLGVRMDRHCDNAEKVVEFLAGHAAVSEVFYPGLEEHPGHEVASRQMKRYGGIVSFRVTGGEQHALDVCAKTEVFTLAESLGGIESLIEHPGPDDPRERGRHRPRGPRRPDPAQRRHRDRRRPARRPGPGPWLSPDRTRRRFTLANERTLLAYQRTAIGLMAGGDRSGALLRRRRAGGAARRRHAGHRGAFAAVGGYVQFRRVDAAIREGRPIGKRIRPPTSLSLAMLLCLALAGAYVISAALTWSGFSASTSARRSPRPRSSTLTPASCSATASHRTTLDTDVLDGVDACRPSCADRRRASAEVLACSSAGGGLRIAVVGTEELVTAEAGRRVALSSGGKVVARARPAARRREQLAALLEARPDVLLLVGGTDGGNAEVARGATPPSWRASGGRSRSWSRATSRPRAVSRSCSDGRTPYVLADNVVPRIGVLAPESARARDPRGVPRHVIGGKGLSKRGRLHRDGAGARRPTSCSPASRCWPREVGRRRRGRRHRRRHDRRALRRTPRPGGRRSLARGGGQHAGHPHRRGRPRHALERGEHLGGRASRRGCSTTTSAPPPYDAPRTRPSSRPPTPSATRTSCSPRPRPPWPCAATSAARGSWSVPTDASSSAPARTCARWPCSSARVACCATAAPGSAGRILGG